MSEIVASVVVPARDAADVLRMQLASLAAQQTSFHLEIIVVCNSSLDGTGPVAASFLNELPDMRIVSADGAVGSGAVRNVGAALARGEYLLFCDADDRVDAAWVQQSVLALKRWDAIGGRLELERLNTAITRAWRAPLVHTDANPVVAGFLPSPTTANCGVKTAVFRELGGFKEEFRQSVDNDFFWRLQLKGYSVGFAPESLVHYRHRTTIRAVFLQSYQWGRGHAHLYSQFRVHGMPRSDVGSALIAWGRLIVMALPSARSYRSRGIWARRAGYRLGRLAGSVKHRVVYL